MPAPKNQRIAYVLSLLIVVLAATASIGGLFLEDLYRDTPLYRTVWRSNDIVTLLIVVPGLVGALLLSRQGSLRAQLVWMGLLGYIFYNYAFYLFGAAFNWFFLLYVALFSLGMFALAIGLYNLNPAAIKSHFSTHTPVRGIGLFLLFIALPLGIIEASQSFAFILTGKLPETPTLIFALDLTFIVPSTLLAAILLWRRNPWGYILGSMMLVKAFTYGTVLSLSTALIAGIPFVGTLDPLMPFYVFVALGGFVGTLVLLYYLKPYH